jgi:hypothetical protein
MTVFPILDVAIGLAFVYLLLALINTTVMEWIAHLRKRRGRMLERGTQRLLGEEDARDPVLTKAYFSHPLISSLGDGKRKPSYIPGKFFAKALRDVVEERRGQADTAERAKAEPIPERLDGTLRTLAASSGAAAGQLPDENTLVEWYDQAMERISGTYKRQTRTTVLLIAIAITLLMNADTVTLTRDLWQSPTLRATVVEGARVRLEQGAPLETVEYTEPDNPQPTPPIEADTTASPNQLLAEEQALLGQLFGWKGELDSLKQEKVLWLLRHLVGWALTALAVSLGAPFWFDTLNRFMSLRGAGAVTPKAAGKEGKTSP